MNLSDREPSQLIESTLIDVVSRLISGVTMREKKGGALQKLKKRLSHSFGRLCKYYNITVVISPHVCHVNQTFKVLSYELG